MAPKSLIVVAVVAFCKCNVFSHFFDFCYYYFLDVILLLLLLHAFVCIFIVFVVADVISMGFLGLVSFIGSFILNGSLRE